MNVDEADPCIGARAVLPPIASISRISIADFIVWMAIYCLTHSANSRAQ
jgi:hypothetical protein